MASLFELVANFGRDEEAQRDAAAIVARVASVEVRGETLPIDCRTPRWMRSDHEPEDYL
jgi:hypothetical protein